MQRIDVLRGIAALVTPDDLLATSLGATMNDWWNVQPGDNTLYVGTLGSVTTTALGMAVSVPHRRVIAIESDGGVLFNLGALCTLGAERPANLTVLVIDNGMYESIGGPPTHTAGNADIAAMAEAAGCINCRTATDAADAARSFAEMLDDGEPGYLVAKVEPGVHPWPADKLKVTDGIEDKYRFMRYVERLEGTVVHAGPEQY
jgi:thiamine pyrophosphate-dependent acetolactate synthase large subunit-like protein